MGGGVVAPDVTVNVTNRAPTLTFTVDGATADKTIIVGDTITLSSTITDPDGNANYHSIWWDLGTNSQWANAWVAWNPFPISATGWSAMSANSPTPSNGSNSTVSAKWTPTAPGTYLFHAAGGDTAGAWEGATPKSVIKVVVIGNTRPTVSIAADKTLINPGESVTLTSTATDPDGDLTGHNFDWCTPNGDWRWNIANGGASSPTDPEEYFSDRSSNNRTVAFTPTMEGPYTVRFAGRDYRGAMWNTSNQLTITVNRAPTLSATVPASITYGDTAPIQVSATDADGNLRYISVHVSKWSDDKATMLTTWRLIRPSDLINDTAWWMPDAVTNAVGIVMSAGNGATDVANLSTTRNWTPDQGAGQYRFHIRSRDSLNRESFQDVWMTVGKANQAALTVSASPNVIAQNETSALTISGGSGVGAVSYSCTAGGSISGSTFMATALSGTVTVTATKAGDNNYNSTTATTTITISVPVYATALFTPATATAPAAVQAVWSTTGATSVAVSGPSGFSATTATGLENYNLAAGTYTLTVVAQGFRGPVTRTASITVSAANSAPSVVLNRIAGGGSIQPGYYTYAGDTIAVQAVTTDVDANLDRIEWSIDGGTPSVAALNGGSSSPAVLVTLQEGVNTIVATVFDSAGAVKSQTFSITVVQPTTSVTIEAQAKAKANMSNWLQDSAKATATKTVNRMRGPIQ